MWGIGVRLGLPCGPKKTVYISIFIEDLSRDSVFFGTVGKLWLYQSAIVPKRERSDCVFFLCCFILYSILTPNRSHSCPWAKIETQLFWKKASSKAAWRILAFHRESKISQSISMAPRTNSSRKWGGGVDNFDYYFSIKSNHGGKIYGGPTPCGSNLHLYIVLKKSISICR